MKNQKGISLVTLALTIIVLLILAGVAVYMVIGPDGVLTVNKKEEQNTNNTSIIEGNKTENIINNNTNETPNENTTNE